MKRNAVAFAVLATAVAVSFQPWRDAQSRPPPAPTSIPALPAALRPAAFSPRSPSPIAIENRRRGTRAWRLDPRAARTVEGFAAPAGVAAGAPVELFVRTAAPEVRAEIYRLGFYGGTGGRLVDRAGPTPGDPQVPCVTRGGRRTVECPWRPSITIATGRDWVSGAYLAKLVDSAGAQSYVPFTVLERAPRAPLLFVSAVTTWQAYNGYGGRNLYRKAGEGRCARLCPGRSRAVSFDRPYTWPGAGNLFDEFPAIRLIESRGLDVGYATSLQVQARTVALGRRRVFLSAGHDEYYSTAMRSALERALSGGTSLAFLGANDIYRHIRFQSSPLGPNRVEVNYKSASEDPLFASDPAETTGQWRGAPLSDPEQTLLGAQYNCCIGEFRCPAATEDWTPTGRPAWLFRGTGLQAGRPVPGIVAGEVDRIYPDAPIPRGDTVVAATLNRCGGRTMPQQSTFYVSASGGAVFDAGEEFFPCALDATPAGHCLRGWVSPGIRRMVVNLLDAMLARRFS